MWLPKFENLELNAPCELLCPDCPARLEREPPPEKIRLQKINSWCVHLTGGNPLRHPQINHLLVELKKQKHFTLLTTCGGNLADFEKQILLLLDGLLLYVPAFSRENAALQAGLNSVSRQESAIEYLQELKKKFAVLYPVNSATIADLPDLYNKINKKNSFLILLYDRKTDLPLQRVEKKYLHYYAARRNAAVYEYAAGGAYNCLDFARHLARMAPRNLWFFAKLFFKFYLQFYG
jgi:organic radical activating enzyme